VDVDDLVGDGDSCILHERDEGTGVGDEGEDGIEQGEGVAFEGEGAEAVGEYEEDLRCLRLVCGELLEVEDGVGVEGAAEVGAAEVGAA
jgi:hypothetical protein